MHTKINLRVLKEIAPPAAFFAGGVLAWYALIALFDIPGFLLPRPEEVFAALVGNLPFLLGQLGVTMVEAAGGYALAAVASFLVAALFVHSTAFEKGLYPYVLALKITPVLALAPFLVLWFGLGIISKILIVALVCFFPLLVTTLKGLKTVDEARWELFKSFSATPWQIFTKLRLPGALPYVFAGLKITTVLALTGAFVAEFISGNQGIGHVIISSTRTLESAMAFAAIGTAILGGLALYVLVSVIEKRVVFWQHVEEM